jgi:hypothetical protein
LQPYESRVEDLIELSNYLRNEIDRYIESLPIEISKIYNNNINNSLKAHNAVNLICGNKLDFIEEKALISGIDTSIISFI